jgi:hypothetical protein
MRQRASTTAFSIASASELPEVLGMLRPMKTSRHSRRARCSASLRQRGGFREVVDGLQR